MPEFHWMRVMEVSIWQKICVVCDAMAHAAAQESAATLSVGNNSLALHNMEFVLFCLKALLE